MRPISILFALSATLVSTTTAAPSAVPVNFDILRGHTLQSARKDVDRLEKLYNREFHKRDDVDDTAELEVIQETIYYSVELTIGGTDFKVLLDTGSSDLWVYGSDNRFCSTTSGSNSKKRQVTPDISLLDEKLHAARSPGAADILGRNEDRSLKKRAGLIDCESYGTLDTSSSKVFTSNQSLFYISYIDTTYAVGEYGTADISFGDIKVNDFFFAVAHESDSVATVFGIGLEGLQASNSSFMDEYSPGGAFTYPTLTSRLKRQGTIAKEAYSIYMDKKSAEGTLLFGGIDHAKYKGKLVTLPLLNSYGKRVSPKPTTFLVSLGGLKMHNSTNTFTLLKNSIRVALDTGSTYNHLPAESFAAITKALGATYSRSYGEYIMKCPKKSTGMTLDFSFKGLNVSIPVDDALLPVDKSGEVCAVKIGSRSEEPYILGDTFLRHVYAVFDLEDLEIQMAVYKSTDKSDIEVLSASRPNRFSDRLQRSSSSSIRKPSSSSTIRRLSKSSSSSIRKSSSTIRKSSSSTRKSTLKSAFASRVASRIADIPPAVPTGAFISRLSSRLANMRTSTKLSRRSSSSDVVAVEPSSSGSVITLFSLPSLALFSTLFIIVVV